MARPILVTQYRNTTDGACHVYLRANGSLEELFAYGTGNLATDYRAKQGNLSTHFNGKIWSIQPRGGIFSWDPQNPTVSGILRYEFTGPSASATHINTLGWNTIQKNGETQIMCGFQTSLTESRFVFVGDNEEIYETATITRNGDEGNASTYRGIVIDNKIYVPGINSTNNTSMIIDPITEGTTQISFPSTADAKDFCVHDGTIYALTSYNTATVGLGSQLWSLNTYSPRALIEWNAKSFAPAAYSQPVCIFSHGGELIMMTAGSGQDVNDSLGVWKATFNGDGVVVGIEDVALNSLSIGQTLNQDNMKIFSAKIYNSVTDGFDTHIYIADTSSSDGGRPYHEYKWNGSSVPATYLGACANEFNFDTPGHKQGGGGMSFTDSGELSFRVTSVSGNGTDARVGYFISGESSTSGVAIIVRYDNNRDTPETMATVTPYDKGVASGVYIAGLTAGESGYFTWDITSDRIQSGDLPFLTAKCVRIA